MPVAHAEKFPSSRKTRTRIDHSHAFSPRITRSSAACGLHYSRSAMADTTLFQTILCPVDFSDHSRQALAYAALLASRSKGRLVVIFVEDPMLAAAAAVAYDEKTLIDKARKELRRLVERTIAPIRPADELGHPRRGGRPAARGDRVGRPSA